jgi:methylisocitrate lyase
MTPLSDSPGSRFRQALEDERPLQIPGVINALCALFAERAGFRSLYLSGAGVANAAYGLPDLGVTSMHDVLEEARRITAACPLPLLVDIDTGWGNSLTIARAIKEMIRADVAAVHLEDQVDAKRCGHRAGKQLVPASKMIDRLKAACDARTDSSFVIMARTDAAAVEGLEAAIQRAGQYAAAGADMIFAEALGSIEDFRQFTSAIDVPVLANITEFGKTPLLTVEELRGAGVRMVLYPLTAFRAMNAAACAALKTLRESGTQRDIIRLMQTRAELYEILNYESLERQLSE